MLQLAIDSACALSQQGDARHPVTLSLTTDPASETQNTLARSRTIARGILPPSWRDPKQWVSLLGILQPSNQWTFVWLRFPNRIVSFVCFVRNRLACVSSPRRPCYQTSLTEAQPPLVSSHTFSSCDSTISKNDAVLVEKCQPCCNK